MYMYVYVCICMYMYVYVCICMYMYVYVCMYMYVFICMYMYAYVCICMYMSACLCLCLCLCLQCYMSMWIVMCWLSDTVSRAVTYPCVCVRVLCSHFWRCVACISMLAGMIVRCVCLWFWCQTTFIHIVVVVGAIVLVIGCLLLLFDPSLFVRSLAF